MPEEALDTGLPDTLDASILNTPMGQPASGGGAPVVTLPRLLIISDTLALLAALLVSDVASSAGGQAALQPWTLALFGVMLPAWIVGARLYGLYRVDGRPATYRTAHEWVNLGHLVLTWTVAFWVVALTTQIDDPARGQLLVFAVSAIAFLTAGRATSRALARRWDGYAQSAVIVGAGEVGQLLARKLLRHPEYGIELVGFVDTAPKQRRPDTAHVPILGEVDDLASIVRDVRRRPGDRGVLETGRPEDAGPGTPARGAERARRRRPAHVRDDRAQCRAAARRGDPTRQHLATAHARRPPGE